MLGLVIGDGGDVVRIDGEELVQASTVMATVTKGASSLLSMIITINAAARSVGRRSRPSFGIKRTCGSNFYAKTLMAWLGSP